MPANYTAETIATCRLGVRCISTKFATFKIFFHHTSRMSHNAMAPFQPLDGSGEQGSEERAAPRVLTNLFSEESTMYLGAARSHSSSCNIARSAKGIILTSAHLFLATHTPVNGDRAAYARPMIVP